MKEKRAKSPDLTKLLNKRHQNKWVAFSPDYKKVTAVANSLLELQNKKQEKDVVMHILPFNVGYAPYEV